MSFMSGAVTFQRFRVEGPPVRLFTADHLGRLKAHANAHAQPVGAGSRVAAWTAGRHVLDTVFTELKNVYPDHLTWSYRETVQRPPADLFKAYYETELATLAAMRSDGKPTARDRREAREHAISQTLDEGKDGRHLRRAEAPAVWDAARSEVYLGTASESVADRFMLRFAATFEQNLTQSERLADRLHPVSAGTLAVRLNPAAESADLSPFVPDTTPDRAAWSPVDGVPDHLGSEFLVWLWHRSQRSDTVTANGDEVTFFFSGGMRLDCPRAATGDDTINHDSAARTPEARAGLLTGKLPTKAALTFVRFGRLYSLKLDARTFGVSGLKLPPAEDGLAGRDLDEHRLRAVGDCVDLLDAVYGEFLSLRLSAGWAGELADVQRWVKAAGRKAGVR